MWRTLRGRLRAGALLLWTLFVVGLYLLCWPFFGFRIQRLRVVRRPLLKFWGWGSSVILGLRLTVKGPVPKPPFILVTNHTSYADVILLTRVTGTALIGKSDMESWPLIGFIMKVSHMMFINRVSGRDALRVIDRVKEEIKHKDGLTFFPEGICSRGVTIEHFYPAVFEAAAQAQQPIHVAAIHYATPPGEPAAGDDVVWWRWEPLAEHLGRFLRLPYFEATIQFAAEPVPPSKRKIMASAAHAKALEIFVPMEQGILPELPPPPEGIAPPPPRPSRRKRMVLRSRLQMRKMERKMRRVRRRGKRHQRRM